MAPALFIMLAAERFIVRAISKIEYPMEYGREMTYMIDCNDRGEKKGVEAKRKEEEKGKGK